MKIVWKILFGVAVAVALLIASGIYAGHRESSVAISAIKGRLSNFQNVQVSISKYVRKANNHYVCGMATYRDKDVKSIGKLAKDKEKSSLFVVIEKGVFPSVFLVSLDFDTMFSADYFPECS